MWSNGDINKKGKCLAAWETACKPKNQGGLGIIDISNQNNALLMKHLEKFYNKADIPWVSFGLNSIQIHRPPLMQEALWDPFGGKIS